MTQLTDTDAIPRMPPPQRRERLRRVPDPETTLEELRKLPRVDTVLKCDGVQRQLAAYGRERVVAAIRGALVAAREAIQMGHGRPSDDALLWSVCERLEQTGRPSLRRVINASGVILHTNLGRAPLSEEAIAAMTAVAAGYSNLEYDLDEGARGSRYRHCSALLAELSGAEDGLIVNNNAASVMILLAAFARGRDVIVSRGQLVEIGGGFRIPDVMRESGAQLVEVGATNRTYVADYERAITDRTVALMTIHRSNFRMFGFVHDPNIAELAQVAQRRGILLIDDLGSGTFLDTDPYGLPHEPKVQERIAAGASLVCFSGDKLLGGPQAGFIVGRKSLIDALKRFPMLRALRVDKVTLAGIEATLRHYAKGDAHRNVPVWRVLAMSREELEERALGWKERLALDAQVATVVMSTSAVGGGSLPGLTLPTWALALRVAAPDEFLDRLRTYDPPVVARIENNAVLLDPRTVMPSEDETLLAALHATMASANR